MQLSVVVPVKDEAPNIEPLIEEIQAALGDRIDYEIVYVDDGSTDSTAEILQQVARRIGDRLQVLRHATSCGQSTALWNGVTAARATLIATLDGDGQNDPVDVPRLLETFVRGEADGLQLVTGHRVRRSDSVLRLISSRVANSIRSALLKDATPDTGCGLKVFRREAFLALPYFDHMHRFLPALVQRQGGKVLSVPVNHRARQHGRSKYGINNRLWVGIVDLFGVAWLMRRERRWCRPEYVSLE